MEADRVVQVWQKSNRMFRAKPEKEAERYYLLPGMGGRAARRKQMVFWKWSIIVGLVFAMILAGVMYLINRYSP